jgi:hypothetical protein
MSYIVDRSTLISIYLHHREIIVRSTHVIDTCPMNVSYSPSLFLCLSILLPSSHRYEYAKRKYVADPLLAQFLLFDMITTYTSRLSIGVLLTYPEVHYLGHDGTEVHGASRHVYIVRITSSSSSSYCRLVYLRRSIIRIKRSW